MGQQAVLCLFLLFIWPELFCNAEECRQAVVTLSPICDTLYGTILRNSSGVRSLVDCISMCSNDILCQSAIYDNQSETCRTSSDILEAPFDICGADNVLYAISDMHSTSCYSAGTDHGSNVSETTLPITAMPTQASSPPASVIFTSCVNDTVCSAISDAECRHGKCHCVPGLSHDPSTDMCVPDCANDEYGLTFQPDLGHYLDGHSNSMIDNVSDPAQCMDLCVAESTFVCRSAEFLFTIGRCYLSVDTVATVAPSAHIADANYNLYQRDCAP